jgi:hypothetical protein
VLLARRAVSNALKHAATEIGIDCRIDLFAGWKVKTNPQRTTASSPKRAANNRCLSKIIFLDASGE